MGKQTCYPFFSSHPSSFITFRIEISLKTSKMIIVLKLWSLPVTRSFCCLICSFSNRCCKRAWWLLFGFPSKATWGWVEDGGIFPPYCPAKVTPGLSVWVSPFCFSLNDDEACQDTMTLVTAFHCLGHCYLHLIRWSYIYFLNTEEKVKIFLLHFDCEMKREEEQALQETATKKLSN